MRDLLVVRVTGGTVVAGAPAIEALNAFDAVSLAPDSSILDVAGGSDAVLFLAPAPGQTRIEVLQGDPRRTTVFDLVVEA